MEVGGGFGAVIGGDGGDGDADFADGASIDEAVHDGGESGFASDDLVDAELLGDVVNESGETAGPRVEAGFGEAELFDLEGSADFSGALEDGGQAFVFGDLAGGVGAGELFAGFGVDDDEEAEGGDVDSETVEVVFEVDRVVAFVGFEEGAEGATSILEAGELDEPDGDVACVVGVDGVESAFEGGDGLQNLEEGGVDSGLLGEVGEVGFGDGGSGIEDALVVAEEGVGVAELGGVGEGDGVTVELEIVFLAADDFSERGGRADESAQGAGGFDVAGRLGHRGAVEAFVGGVKGICPGLEAVEIGFVGLGDPLVPFGVGAVGWSGVVGGNEPDAGLAGFVVLVEPGGAFLRLDDLIGGVGVGVLCAVAGRVSPFLHDAAHLVQGEVFAGGFRGDGLADDDESGNHGFVGAGSLCITFFDAWSWREGHNLVDFAGSLGGVFLVQ